MPFGPTIQLQVSIRPRVPLEPTYVVLPGDVDAQGDCEIHDAMEAILPGSSPMYEIGVPTSLSVGSE